ncbi:MAG: endonuclease/exonuclease/phosphatase family protein [Magnetospiraceae bacterium]
MSLRIITLNTWKGDGSYTARLHAMARGLAALSPDIVFLQEALSVPGTSLDTTGYLAEALELAPAFCPARDKWRDVEGVSRRCFSGLGVLLRGRVLMEQQIALPLDARDPDRVGFMVRGRVGDERLCLLNLHLTHLPDAHACRLAQLQAALQALDPWGGERRIVAGDFNAAPGAPLHEWIAGVSEPPLRLLTACGEDGVPLSTLQAVDGPDGAVDHILLVGGGGGGRPSVRRVLESSDPDSGVFASDHYGLLADLACVELGEEP